MIRQNKKQELLIVLLDVIEKPLEVYYEQIAKRNATGLASVEKTEEKRARMVPKIL